MDACPLTVAPYNSSIYGDVRKSSLTFQPKVLTSIASSELEFFCLSSIAHNQNKSNITVYAVQFEG